MIYMPIRRPKYVPGRVDNAELPMAAEECRWHVSCRPDKETLIVVSGTKCEHGALQCFTEKFATDDTVRWRPRIVDTYTT